MKNQSYIILINYILNIINIKIPSTVDYTTDYNNDLLS